MRVLLAVLPLILVACGPSEAERAFASCQQMMAAQNFDAAVAACDVAVHLDPDNDLYLATRSEAGLSAYRATSERLRQARSSAAMADAARRQAAAAEDQAMTLQREELRRTLDEPRNHR